MLNVTADTRKPFEIARDVYNDYRNKGKDVPAYALPYARALRTLATWDEPYGCDSAEMVAIYMLSNLSTWRGEKAREVKAELRKILGLK